MRPTVEPRQTGNGAAIHLTEIPSPTGSIAPSTDEGGGRRFGVGTASALIIHWVDRLSSGASRDDLHLSF
jgi:hypothetical protein